MRYLDFKTYVLVELTDKVKQVMRDRFKKEQPNLTDQQIDFYLSRWDRFAPSFPVNNRDITRLKFSDVEQLIDAAEAKAELKGKNKNKEPQQQPVSNSEDLLYDQNNLVILKGDLREKCIRYGTGYKWCISRRDASNMFFSYRMRMNEPVFYFVFDKDRQPRDPWHAVVIYVDKDNRFMVAKATNTGDTEMSWAQISQAHPKLKDLQNIFKPQPLTPDEQAEYKKYENNLDNQGYAALTLEEKYKYIQFGHLLSKTQQLSTPDELLGVYAKQSVNDISPDTYRRLSNADRRHVIKSILEHNLNPVAFAKKTLEAPWSEAGLPSDIVDQMHQRIIKKNGVSSYAKSVIGGRWPEAETIIVNNPKQSVKYAKIVIGGRWPEAEPAILKNPEYAVKYATHVIRGRWPAAEPLIANSDYAIHYIKNVLKKRWPAAEPKILENPAHAYYYAKNILKKRWPEAEPGIIQNPDLIYSYTQEVVGGRWPEAESEIMKDPDNAYYYAKYILKKRWPAAEPYILKNDFAAYKYAKDVIGSRWPAAEPEIVKQPFVAILYAEGVIGGRWPEAESEIMKDPQAALRYSAVVLKKRWPAAEPIIATNQVAAYYYAKDVIGGRWPEAEAIILKSAWRDEYLQLINSNP